MFALVTQADGSSRGLPFVTFLLAAAILGGYASIHVGDAAIRAAEVELKLDTAVAYFVEHPYLEPDARTLKKVGGPEAVEEMREEFFAKRRTRGLSVIPSSLIRRSQSKFDGLLAETYAEMMLLPEWSRGVVDAQSPSANLLAHVLVHGSVAALVVSLFFVLLLGAAIEDVWGPLLFGGFSVLAIGVSGATYAAAHGALGAPWSGASGLAAALLGAYFVQSIRWPALFLGGLSMPGWLMALAWLGGEYAWVRGLWPGNTDMPFTAHAVAFGLGVVVAVAMRQLGVEDKLRKRDEKASELMINPVLDQAMADHEAGRSAQAFDALKAEFTRKPRNRDVALGFWTVAQSCGAPDEALPAILFLLSDELRLRRREQAVSHWKELAPFLGDAPVDPALLVRAGEALLDAGEPGEALTAVGRAVEAARLPGALAQRVVRLARDLDPGLTARAAARALEDPQLDPAQREELEALSADVRTAVTSSQRPAPVAADATPVSSSAPASAAAPTAAAAPAPRRAAPAAEPTADLDPEALSVESLSADLEPAAASPSTAEIESWNDPGLVEDLSAELPSVDAGLDTAIDTGAQGSAADPDGAWDPSNYDAVDLGEDDGETTERMAAAALDAAGGDALPAAETRALKLLEGAPLALEEASIKLEIDGRGKTRLAFERLEALAVGAVRGLGERPVLVVDLVLNWMSLADEPLRVIRLRSDRFDPRALFPDAAKPLDALTLLISHLLDSGDVTPLPSPEAVRGGKFASFEDLAQYERDVLMVQS